MLAKVFVDTAAWLALINPDDALHSQAIQVRMQLQKEKSRLVTTDFVFLEVADALSAVKLRSNTIAYLTLPLRMRGIPVSASLLKFSSFDNCSEASLSTGV